MDLLLIGTIRPLSISYHPISMSLCQLNLASLHFHLLGAAYLAGFAVLHYHGKKIQGGLNRHILGNICPSLCIPIPDVREQEAPPVAIYHSVNEVPSVCFEIKSQNGVDDVFFSRQFLGAIEQNPPADTRFAYLVFQRQNRIIGFAILQIKYFSAAKSLRLKTGESAFIYAIKKQVARMIRYNTLVCGNLLLTGEHGYAFRDGAFASPALETAAVAEGLAFARRELAREGIRINATLIKDLAVPHPFSKAGYNQFSVEPNMVMTLDPNWKCQGDYLNALSSKYRVRAKRAFKKAEGIEKVELDARQLRENSGKLMALYRQIADDADFNLFYLNDLHFAGLKQRLGEDFRVFAYYLDGEMIAFYSTILNGGHLEAHFLGYEHSLNAERQIYLNMLFDMIGLGIGTGMREIVFARTATVIKNSVGAQPIDAYLYLRYENAIINRMLPLALRLLRPKNEALARSPFK